MQLTERSKQIAIIWLCFFLSISISIGIVAHSYLFVITEIVSHWILALVFIGVVEVGYITLPYIATLNFKTKLDKFYIILLFIISIIPATIQTSANFVDKQTNKIITEPMIPIKSTLAASYSNEISSLGEQISANNKLITQITNKTVEDKFISYRTSTYREQNVLLTKRKNDYMVKLSNINEEYERQSANYRKDKHNYDLQSQKNTIQWITNKLKLSYSLILVFILQLVNARFAFHGSKVLEKLQIKKKKPGPKPKSKKKVVPKKKVVKRKVLKDVNIENISNNVEPRPIVEGIKEVKKKVKEKLSFGIQVSEDSSSIKDFMVDK